MTREEVVRKLAASVGKTVRLEFNNVTTEVRVVSSDPDGVLCRTEFVPDGDTGADFWVSYGDIHSVEGN
jgi:hypothetical protein